MLLQLLLLFTGCDQAPLRGQQPKASGSAGGYLLKRSRGILKESVMQRRRDAEHPLGLSRGKRIWGFFTNLLRSRER